MATWHGRAARVHYGIAVRNVVHELQPMIHRSCANRHQVSTTKAAARVDDGAGQNTRPHTGPPEDRFFPTSPWPSTVQCHRSVNLLCCGKMSYNPAAVFQSLMLEPSLLQVVSGVVSMVVVLVLTK